MLTVPQFTYSALRGIYAPAVLQSSVYSEKLLRCNTSFGSRRAHELTCAWMVRKLIYIVTFLTHLL